MRHQAVAGVLRARSVALIARGACCPLKGTVQRFSTVICVLSSSEVVIPMKYLIIGLCPTSSPYSKLSKLELSTLIYE